ncbi:MAG: cell division protein FtsB [Sterolibacteriaceae bacterium]|nr:cell division protein FtsB [Sterolibacteriaceae bacterium]
MKRVATLALLALLLGLQWPLWFGKGGLLQARRADLELSQQKQLNARLEQRNVGLDAEVRDLKTGYDAIEERARFELGLTKPGEIFVQVPQK